MDIITKEKAKVIKEAVAIIKDNEDRIVYDVNEKHGVCTIGYVYSKDGYVGVRLGTSFCAPGDRFIKPIGMVIALYRAKGRRVPEKFLHF